MSLDSILGHIIDKANIQKEGIIQEAGLEAERIIQKTKEEAERLYQDIMEKEKYLNDRHKQKLIVNARLEARKRLLQVKQELMESVFEKLKATIGIGRLKKQLVSGDKVQEINVEIDFYLDELRFDCEAEVAKILFE